MRECLEIVGKGEQLSTTTLEALGPNAGGILSALGEHAVVKVFAPVPNPVVTPKTNEDLTFLD